MLSCGLVRFCWAVRGSEPTTSAAKARTSEAIFSWNNTFGFRGKRTTDGEFDTVRGAHVNRWAGIDAVGAVRPDEWLWRAVWYLQVRCGVSVVSSRRVGACALGSGQSRALSGWMC